MLAIFHYIWLTMCQPQQKTQKLTSFVKNSWINPRKKNPVIKYHITGQIRSLILWDMDYIGAVLRRGSLFHTFS